MNKMPGLMWEGVRMQPLSLDLSLTDAFRAQRHRIAHEQSLPDGLVGNPTHFVRRDETDAAWVWIDAGVRCRSYHAGSNGPDAGEGSFRRPERETSS